MRLLIILFSLIFLENSTVEAKERSALNILLESAPILNAKAPLKPADLLGKIVLVDFWTYGCINCQHVIPDLKYLEENYPKELVVIGVHSAKFENERGDFQIKKAISRLGLHHPVINDSKFIVWNAFGVQAWPTLVLINPEGSVDSSFSGEGNRRELDKRISELTKKYQGKLNKKTINVEKEIHTKRFKFPAKI